MGGCAAKRIIEGPGQSEGPRPWGLNAAGRIIEGPESLLTLRLRQFRPRLSDPAPYLAPLLVVHQFAAVLLFEARQASLLVNGSFAAGCARLSGVHRVHSLWAVVRAVPAAPGLFVCAPIISCFLVFCPYSM